MRYLQSWTAFILGGLCSLSGCEEIPIAPELRSRILGPERTITVLHHSPKKALDANGRASRYPTVMLADPLATVRDRFVEIVRTRGAAANFQLSPPFSSGSEPTTQEWREFLKQFGDGLILEFTTWQWAIGVWGRDPEWLRPWLHTSDQRMLLMGYRVRARLLDVDQDKVIWQYICMVDTDRHEMEAWTADNNALLKQKAPALAEECAKELAEKFLS